MPPPSHVPSLALDPRTVRAAQSGDAVAMSNLIDVLLPWVGRLCGSIALDAGPDAAQEALIQIMRDLKSLRDPHALRGWARRIATREAVRHALRARREPNFDPLEARPHASLTHSPHDPSLARDVVSVLEALTPEQRAILVLRDLEGLSENETAELLDVAHGTIKSRLHRAREAFRKRWPT